MIKVDILGVPYEIVVCKRENDERLNNNPNIAGYCDFSVKKIVVEDQYQSSLGQTDVMEDISFVQNNILKHEIVHAVAEESGLGAESPLSDEVVVDYIALQLDKMYSIAKEACIKVEEESKKNMTKHIMPKIKSFVEKKGK